MSFLDIASEIAQAGATFAGLLLVFLGAAGARIDSYRPEAKKTMRARMQSRGWFAFAGIVLSLAATILALVAKGSKSEVLAFLAAGLLALTLVTILVAALIAAEDIR